MRRWIRWLGAGAAVLTLYLCFWPVPVEPVAWQAPPNPGYTGPFATNERLAAARMIELSPSSGPEDAVEARDGSVLAAMHDGSILRIATDTGDFLPFAETGGRPLGIEFGPDGALYVADAYRGLLRIDSRGAVTLLAGETDTGSPILYADDLDVASDGTVYFSDASTRFAAKDGGGTLTASILDLLEHSSNGRVLRYDPGTGRTSVVADGLNFPNGVALTEDETALLVVETGSYRILRFPIQDGVLGQPDEIIGSLPGFPDNINPAGDGTFWTGLVSPRNALADSLSGNPFLRKMIARLPALLRPKPTRYGFVIKLDEDGNVIETMQDPEGRYALTTGAITLANGDIAITSLSEPRLAILPAE